MTETKLVKIGTAIRYITEHPVQFGATRDDSHLLTESSDFKTDLVEHFVKEKADIHGTTVRELAKSAWNFYIVWVKLPNTKKSDNTWVY